MSPTSPELADRFFTSINTWEATPMYLQMTQFCSSLEVSNIALYWDT